ncbi:MAG: hypothetical protein QG654_155 [Patescibacteria group bacterium]|jgi:hypothetical protein|nr:hypothetical protein [Patescibacteria group bacterium]
MGKKIEAGKPFENSRISYKKPRKVPTKDQLIHDEVSEMLDDYVQQPYSILKTCSIAKKRPLPGKYDDESPSPKPIISFVRNAVGKSRCVRCLMAPQRRIKDLEVKDDLFVEMGPWRLNQSPMKRAKKAGRTFYATACSGGPLPSRRIRA